MQRLTTAVLSLVVALLAVSSLDAHANVALVGAAVAAALLLGLALRDGAGRLRVLRVVATPGPAHDERRLHGAYRCQSSPDAPGRPRPRAPGRSARPAA
ncbi:MAG TPA: DUF6412 domain-containing protein [Streptosporangiales bacterium]